MLDQRYGKLSYIVEKSPKSTSLTLKQNPKLNEHGIPAPLQIMPARVLFTQCVQRRGQTPTLYGLRLAPLILAEESKRWEVREVMMCLSIFFLCKNASQLFQQPNVSLV